MPTKSLAKIKAPDLAKQDRLKLSVPELFTLEIFGKKINFLPISIIILLALFVGSLYSLFGNLRYLTDSQAIIGLGCLAIVAIVLMVIIWIINNNSNQVRS